MKPIMRHQNQLLFRENYMPQRKLRIRPGERLTLVFQPVNRFGAKPQLKSAPR